MVSSTSVSPFFFPTLRSLAYRLRGRRLRVSPLLPQRRILIAYEALMTHILYVQSCDCARRRNTYIPYIYGMCARAFANIYIYKANRGGCYEGAETCIDSGARCVINTAPLPPLARYYCGRGRRRSLRYRRVIS